MVFKLIYLVLMIGLVVRMPLVCASDRDDATINSRVVGIQLPNGKKGKVELRDVRDVNLKPNPECEPVRVLYMPLPRYPKLIDRVTSPKTVKVELTVNEEGMVSNIKFLEYGHVMFAKSAFNTLIHWRFEPYVCNGKAKKLTVTQKLLFGPRQFGSPF